MVLEYCRMNDLGCVVVHNEAVIETLPGSPILAFTVHEGHSYFYKAPRVRLALMRRRTGEVTKLKKAQRSATTPLTTEWKPWADEIEDGHFFVQEEELPTVRAWFLAQKKHPKVMMKDELRPRGLLYNLTKRGDGQVGTCFVHSLPENSEQIKDWLGQLNIGLEYRGEGLPNVALKVLQRLVKGNRRREWLTGEKKAELLEEYDWRCAMCDSRSSSMEWDHVCRLSESFGEQEFQPLCPACHKEKTEKEARSYDEDQLASHFEKVTWDQYVASPRPPPLVYRAKQVPEEFPGFMIADVRRCRKNALEYCTHPLPVFCPLDDVKRRTEPALGDLNFVTTKYKSFVSQLGYAGVGWQHRVQTEWLLHAGVIG